MEAAWPGQHFLDLLQSAVLVGTLLLATYAAWKDEQARKTANLIALNQQYGQIWKDFFERPHLSRILQKDADIRSQPISDEETVFVNRLIMQSHAVWHAMKVHLFITVEGLQLDVRTFYSLPIPKAVWAQMKTLQNRKFIKFMDRVLE